MLEMCWEFDESGGVMGRSKLDVSHRWRHKRTKKGKNEIKLESDVMKWKEMKGMSIGSSAAAVDLDHRHTSYALATF